MYFSFNNKGACPKCSGLGTELTVDLDLLIDFDKSLNEGAIRHRTWKVGSRYFNIQASTNLFDMDKKIKDYSEEELNNLLYKEPTNFMNKSQGFVQNFSYEGIVSRIISRQADSRGLKINDYDKTFFKEAPCSECSGSRLNKKAREVLVNGLSLVDLLNIELVDLYDFIDQIKEIQAVEIVDKMKKDIRTLIDLGVGYLTLNRGINTLSNGESQKLKLARSMNNALNELIYIMDEPTQGFHASDVDKIIKAVKGIVFKNNTAIVVEHNRKFIESSDNIIDIGPESGTNGGNLLYNGNPHDIGECNNSITAQYLLKKKELSSKDINIDKYYEVNNIIINNIRDLSVKIPLNMLVCITGISGSGKSSMMRYILNHDEAIIKVGRDNVGVNNRSTVASYTHIFDYIRDLFASVNNVAKSEFSFNSSGACPKCGGSGYLKMDMHFLGDIKQVCDDCKGKRYKSEILKYRVKGKNINEVLEMTVEEASNFFESDKIREPLDILMNVGLGYLRLGQTLDTLSGGEVQRVNMSGYLSKEGNIYLFDEPTQGLHLRDIEELIKVLRNMIDKGNTVIVVEHNLDFILSTDYIIDMGPGAGKNGGKIVFEGKLKELIDQNTLTAKALKDYLKQ